MKKISDRDVAMMLQIMACKDCHATVNPTHMREIGGCLCGSISSELRMVNKNEVGAFLRGRLHAFVLFDGRCNPVEVQFGILDIPAAVIDYYRDGLERLLLDEESSTMRDVIAYRREHLNPIRDDWKVLPATLARLAAWLKLKVRKHDRDSSGRIRHQQAASQATRG